MNKRSFLKLSTAMLTGAALSPLSSCNNSKNETIEDTVIRNWAGNITYSTGNIFEPKSNDEARDIIKKCTKLRALGTRHCFNTIADSDANLISTRGFVHIGSIDPNTATISVGGGIRYGDLCTFLYEKGFALHNLASLPHISVAGAVATATHGSGVTNGNLSTAVDEIEILTGAGELKIFSKNVDPDEFAGAIVNLGSLGVATTVKLKLLPAFNVRQWVYLGLPMKQLEEHFDEIVAAGYSVSLFTDWQSENVNQVWIKKIAKEGEPSDAPSEFFGAKLADRDVHPIISVSAENCTPQMGVAGPWYERLPHFKMNFTPSSGEELQAEYFVPRDKAVEAIFAVAKNHKEELKSLLFITEIRTIAADDLWLSTAYGRDSVAIHFTLKQDTAGVAAFLPRLEDTLKPFDARPHWGKQFAMRPSELRSRYEKFDQFKALVAKYDPEGKFRNEFMDHVLSGA
ncbi:D-arabinono-1,4-lactone oxidase [Chryseolinea sp. T2]|uniref:D-arabinono-1,4-lactone oxidase n=1 Tax=Chryseolinea sp. T2 TaxID=3129255 RepID=UPI003077D591